MNIRADKAAIKIAYIGGGSRAWAWVLMNDLAKEKSLSGTVCLYDIDFKAAENNAVIGNRMREYIPGAANWTYMAAQDYETALSGADFVIISILPGTFDEMESDVHAPEEYGIYMPVGDTAGVSGVIRALRAVPMFREFAEKIREYCPDAVVINYTNPMTMCVRAMYSVFPEIRAFGCCHEVFGTQKLLADALKKYTGIGAHFSQINTEVAGINHFTWITRAYYKNIDLFPLFARLADEYGDTGFFTKDFAEVDYVNDCGHKIKFDLFKRFGVIAAAGDRHLAEFCPCKWYLKDDAQIESFKFGRTSVQWRKDNLQERLARAERLITGAEKFELCDTEEAGTTIIKALTGLSEFKTNVNYPNMGQMPQAPANAVVETNAVFSGSGIAPVISVVPLPQGVMTLIGKVIHIQEMTVRAALNYDLKLAFEAFTAANDLDIADSRKLFDKMIKDTMKYLSKEYLL
ncbi:MAG: alpha-glucosidase/alpha-galactosidase [Firmicutes bacterium]|nr:alpha-glucosidase/alpha-galactosidase [Bacillota bacterium]